MFCFRNLFNEETTCLFRNDDIKTFKNIWDPQKGSRLWVLPGHLLFTTSDGCTLLSCDARPMDAPNPVTQEIANVSLPISEILIINNDKPTILVALNNGEVQVYEYKILSYQWVKMSNFHLRVTPNDSKSSEHKTRAIQNVYFNHNLIYWCENEFTATSEHSFKLCKIKIPSGNACELTDDTVEPGVLLMYNCPELNLASLWGGLCICPKLPYSIHVYIVWNSSQLRLFDINAKCIWKMTTKTNEPVDFLAMMAKNVGLWSEISSCVRLCVTLSTEVNNVYILVGSTIISLSANGEIDRKIDLSSLKSANVNECYIHKQIVYTVTESTMSLHSLKNGRLLQEFNFTEYGHVHGIWSCTFFLPLIGFYTDNTVYQLNLKSLNEIFSSDTSYYNEILSYFTQGHLHFLALLKDLICEHVDESDKLPLFQMPCRLQSRALMLAVIQFCREKKLASHNFPLTEDCLNQLLSTDLSTDTYGETKLKQLLQPLVECFVHIEEGKMRIIHGNPSKQDLNSEN